MDAQRLELALLGVGQAARRILVVEDELAQDLVVAVAHEEHRRRHEILGLCCLLVDEVVEVGVRAAELVEFSDLAFDGVAALVGKPVEPRGQLIVPLAQIGNEPQRLGDFVVEAGLADQMTIVLADAQRFAEPRAHLGFGEQGMHGRARTRRRHCRKSNRMGGSGGRKAAHQRRLGRMLGLWQRRAATIWKRRLLPLLPRLVPFGLIAPRPSLQPAGLRPVLDQHRHRLGMATLIVLIEAVE